MSRWGTRTTAVLVAALLAFAGLLSSCGGSDSGSAKSSDEVESKGGGQAGSGNGGGKSQPSEPKDGEGREERDGSVPVGPLRVSGGGSGQFRVKGGDNSIQEFGEESSESELEEAAVALHAFFVSRAEEDWEAACARLSKTVVAQLRLLGEHSKSGKKACRASLAELTPPVPPPVQRESTIVDAGSLRVEGDRGFLIYRGAEGTVYAINMANEDGWKVGALAGVPLS